MLFGQRRELSKNTAERLKENEEKLKNELHKDGKVSKKDVFAMIFSAYIVIIPVVLLALLLLLGLGYLLFT